MIPLAVWEELLALEQQAQERSKKAKEKKMSSDEKLARALQTQEFSVSQLALVFNSASSANRRSKTEL